MSARRVTRAGLRAFALLALLLVAGCKAFGGSATPEQAALQMLSDPASSGGAIVDATSAQKLGEQVAGGSTYVVLSFRRMWNNTDQTCLMMYETHQQGLGGWVSRGGGGTCADNNDPLQASLPMSIMGGTIFGADQDGQDISYVLGRVNDEAIEKVSVTWIDGQTQHAGVENGSVLAIREGEISMKTVVGLDHAGEAVYTSGK